MYTALLLCLLCAQTPVNANNEFLVPPPAGIDVVIDQPVIVQWRCDGSYSWTAHTLEDLTTSDGFHFELIYGAASFDSGALFIRDALSSTSMPSPATSWTTPTPTPSTLPTSVPTSSTPNITLSSSTASAVLTSTPTPTPTNPSLDNDEVLRVGLGVGLGVGIPFLVLIGGIVGYSLFRQRSENRQNVAYELSDGRGGLRFMRWEDRSQN